VLCQLSYSHQRVEIISTGVFVALARILGSS